MSFWEEINGITLFPPARVKFADRPKKLRKRGFGEVVKKRGKYMVSKKGEHRCGMCGEPNHKKRSCPQNKKEGETTTEQGETSRAATRKKAAHKKEKVATKTMGETSRAATRKKAAHKKEKVATKTKVTAPRKQKSKLHERIRQTLRKSVNLWGLGTKAAAMTNNLRRSDAERISTNNNLCNGNSCVANDK
ncbi:hypothetical protein LIER_25047 [Lithospermum erythrorhizon]|uniref:CCHC-type domain-containing protein n=1 Tax=Lithospermum erythrorhizon TaxID=34254 RepID=A0AAV3R4S1_LITER